MSGGRRAWLYERLSRDEDKEMNSLKNQAAILRDFAQKNNYEIVGESFDDNISGMHFDREGIMEVQNAAEANKLDIVIVKDLSRLGRHRIMTAMFVENLRGLGVKVISATENIDTSNESDELLIGFKQLLNDQYARDISRKVRAGYHQKQKTEGIIIIPPFGYIKDKATDAIEVVEECAVIIRNIFEWFVSGMGYKKIAVKLTEQGLLSPAYYQHKFYGKRVAYTKTKIGKEYIWNDKSVKNIVENEQYRGILINRKTLSSKIYKRREFLDEGQQYRHEGIYPRIISDELWEQAKVIRDNRKNGSVRAKNKKTYKYAGLLRCGDCNASMVAMKRPGKSGSIDIEYVCKTYHNVGKQYCQSHRIREYKIDELLYNEIANLKLIADENLRFIDLFIEKWTKQQDDYKRLITGIEDEIAQKQSEIKELIIRSLNEPNRQSLIEEIISEHEQRIKQLKKQVEDYKNSDVISENASNNIQNSTQIINRILEERSLGTAELNMLVERVFFHQDKETDELDIEFILRAPFRKHLEFNEQVKVEQKNSIIITIDTLNRFGTVAV